MQDGGLLMMSPMDAAGEARLAKLRACIRKKFKPSDGRRTKRALEMADEAPTLLKTPRTKVRQRIAQAAQVSSEQLFFQQFGSGVELMSEEFDLARPAGHPILAAKVQTLRQYAPGDFPTASVPQEPQRTVTAPTSFFSFASMAISSSSFASSLSAPSTTTVSQLARPTRIRTPRKAAVKRARAGESSAEKALLSRKPRLGHVSFRSTDYSRSGVSAFSHPTATALSSSLETRNAVTFATKQRDSFQPHVATHTFSMTSPSKFHFSTSATKLFSQCQAPRR